MLMEIATFPKGFSFVFLVKEVFQFIVLFIVLEDYHILDEFEVILLYFVEIGRVNDELIFCLDVDDRFIFLLQQSETFVDVHGFHLRLEVFS